ncbi:MAG: hypothetical protein E6Q97_35665 [Desulfurellales bacterium]|nr:MAG: hypothetical protein E6Q97_35665 [Desulfurellales bacterium]
MSNENEFSQTEGYFKAIRESVPRSSACSTVFVVVQEMDCDHGGGASSAGVYSSEEKAEAAIAKLEADRDAKVIRYKYRTSWFVQKHELDQ